MSGIKGLEFKQLLSLEQPRLEKGFWCFSVGNVVRDGEIYGKCWTKIWVEVLKHPKKLKKLMYKCHKICFRNVTRYRGKCHTEKMRLEKMGGSCCEVVKWHLQHLVLSSPVSWGGVGLMFFWRWKILIDLDEDRTFDIAGSSNAQNGRRRFFTLMGVKTVPRRKENFRGLTRKVLISEWNVLCWSSKWTFSKGLLHIDLP